MLLIQSLPACQNLSNAQRISRKQRAVEPLSLEMTVSSTAQHSNEIQGNVTKNGVIMFTVASIYMQGC